MYLGPPQVGVDYKHLASRLGKGIARFVITVVLPSPGPELVTTSVLIGLSRLENCIFVLKILKASDMGDFGFV